MSGVFDKDRIQIKNTYGMKAPQSVCDACGAVVERWSLVNGSSALFEDDGGDLVPHICHPGAVLLSSGSVSTR